MSDFKFTESFAEVYDRYLVPMDFATHGRRLAERVAVLGPRSVLETAAGTGVVTRELARILPADPAPDVSAIVIAGGRELIGACALFGLASQISDWGMAGSRTTVETRAAAIGDGRSLSRRRPSCVILRRGAIEVRRNNLARVAALYDRHDLEIH
jgi:hypothetical protein